MQTVEEISEALHEVVAHACEPLELAAALESLGITDARTVALGHVSVFSLAETFFEEEYKGIPPAKEVISKHRGASILEELRRFLVKTTLGLSFSLPWILLTVVEIMMPHALDMPPSAGSALSLAIIGSLITTGGLIQVLTRDVTFFTALKEPWVARRFALLLFRYEIALAIACVIAGSICSAYFHLFSVQDFGFAAVTYLLLCLLWTACAVLSAQDMSLLIPLILLGTGGLVFELRLQRRVSAETVPVLWAALAMGAALLLATLRSHLLCRKYALREASAMPSRSIHLYMLWPVALYGVAYFSFLFMDRLCAGSAVPWNSGLTFGLDPVYKHGMDTALFAFLLSATLVEYLSDLFIRRWRSTLAVSTSEQMRSVVRQLRTGYLLFVLLVAVTFAVLMLTACHLLPLAVPTHQTSMLRQILIFGGAGYLVLATGLFGNIVLLSVNAVQQVTKAAGMGCLVDFVVGYTLAHLAGMQMATVGLFLGACVFASLTHRAAWRAMASPDFYFSLM